MFTWSNFFIGLGIFAAGVALVKYSYQLLRFSGEQEWIERYAGAGSTNGIYKIFGVILVIIGLLVATGFGNNVMSFFFSPLKNIFSGFGPQN
jgi:hypothetical protein